MHNRKFFNARVLVIFGLLFPACVGTESETESETTTEFEIEIEAAVDEDSSEFGTGPASFVILANAAVTCTGGSVKNNVGTNLAPPAGSVTTCAPVPGSVHVGDPVAKAAFANFLVKYAALTPKPGAPCTVLTGTLAGVTLPPG